MYIYFKVYVKDNVKKTYNLSYVSYDRDTIYERFANCMIARYINHAPWVKRVCSRCNYDGTYTYKFYGDNDTFYEFRIER